MSNQKNIDNEGRRLLPSGYRIKSISIQNYLGEEKNIENLIGSFTITESLYSPTLFFEASIKDAVNFFESFPLTGQESVFVNVYYKEHDSDIEKEIGLFFFITEYPLYGRSVKNENVQVYKIKGVSEQAYISSQKRISRSYDYSNTVEIIDNILQRDCNLAFSDLAISGDPISRCRHIFTYQTPLQAVELMRQRTFDIHGSPFYFFQSLNGVYNLISHTNIANKDTNPIYRTYYDARNFEGEAGSQKDYIERATRIISCESNLRYAKLSQAREGAFASQTYSLDYSTKTYKGKQYKYMDVKEDLSGYEMNPQIMNNTMEPFPIISPAHQVQKEFGNKFAPLSEFVNASVNYIGNNSMAYQNTYDSDFSTGKNYNQLSSESINNLNAFRALANTISHDITLYGDFDLNPGVCIELKFPKAIAPEDLKEILDESPQNVYDKQMSGKYFISSVQHKFEEGNYYCKVRVKRDSMSIQMIGTEGGTK